MQLAKNKKGMRDYELLENFIAGVVLTGYEVKALRDKQVNFEGSHITILDGEAYAMSITIGRYQHQSQKDTDPSRPRKLLLNKKELLKLQKELSQKGKTAIPTAFILRNNMVKLEIAIVRGLKKHEKESVEKDKQMKKELERYKKGILQPTIA